MNHRRILLIIENVDAIQEVTQVCLETIAGWEVVITNSLNEAIAKATTEKADAIILDLNEIIFDFDCNTILQELHNKPTTQQIPIILLTSTEQYKELSQLTEIGITAAIIKPFDLLTLARQVAVALNWEY
ncbi:response regulator [Plectonema cf. radiosum LEGE 06105]|uniref:Response regulator n=1 Tax=Plectonema cf. radiosum LEGE 06105 TaxID=945769 RepID=A0A8J7FJZ0_9CYAN|nr:response regulator [Plectonema radiosum]MBE9215201.1 response regulator [Plectonema cf. radiosum LEGE 06105]